MRCMCERKDRQGVHGAVSRKVKEIFIQETISKYEMLHKIRPIRFLTDVLQVPLSRTLLIIQTQTTTEYYHKLSFKNIGATRNNLSRLTAFKVGQRHKANVKKKNYARFGSKWIVVSWHRVRDVVVVVAGVARECQRSLIAEYPEHPLL